MPTDTEQIDETASLSLWLVVVPSLPCLVEFAQPVIEDDPPSRSISSVKQSRFSANLEIELPLTKWVAIRPIELRGDTTIVLAIPLASSVANGATEARIAQDDPSPDGVVSLVTGRMAASAQESIPPTPSIIEKPISVIRQQQPVASQPNLTTGNRLKRRLLGAVLLASLAIWLIYFGSQPEPTGGRAIPERGADDVVRDYYQALHRHDKEMVIKLWNKSASELGDLIKTVDKIELFRLNHIALVSDDGRGHAVVEVDVTDKRKNEKPQRWVGPILLQQVGGEWKIASMGLNRVQ